MTSTEQRPACLTLLCCGGTAMARTGGFAGPDEPLDGGGVRKATAFRLGGLAPTAVLSSPASAACQTAAAIGWDATAEPVLADMDWGDWSGLSFEQVAATSNFPKWLSDPASGAPGGESFDHIVRRISPWLAGVPSNGRIVAITHPMTIRAILTAAIGISSEAVLRIDIAPLSITGLSHLGGWRLQALELP